MLGRWGLPVLEGQGRNMAGALRAAVETAGYGVARNRQTVGRESHHARGSCR